MHVQKSWSILVASAEDLHYIIDGATASTRRGVIPMENALSVSTLNRLGFLFLAYGTVTDGELVPEELVVMANRLKRWLDDRRDVRLVEVVEEAGRVYDQHASDDAIRQTAYRYACALRRLTAPAQRRVIADLVEIARADGVVCEGEIRFMSMVMGVFGIGEPNPLQPTINNPAI